jgi:hypothetical protein
MKRFMLLVAAALVGFIGISFLTAAKKASPEELAAANQKKMLERCFPGMVTEQIFNGNLVVSSNMDFIYNPFTDLTETCPDDYSPTPKGEAVLKANLEKAE